MARYGLDYYSSPSFPLSYYGTDSPIAFDASPFKALSSGYKQITLSWNSPYGAWAKLRLVRNPFGYPVNSTDGEIIFTTTRGKDPLTYTDNVGKNKARFYYYSIFVLDQVQLQWVLAGQVTGLAVENFNTQNLMYDYMPRIYKLTTPYTASIAGDNEKLRSFLNVFGFEFDYIRTLIKLITNRYDFENASGTLIPLMLEQFGINYEPEIGYQQNRVLIRDAIQLQTEKGSTAGIREYLSAFSGWSVVSPVEGTPNPSVEGLTVSHNLMLDYNDSSFEEGIGNWTSPDSSAQLLQLKKQDILKFSISSNNANLFLGAHNYKAGDKIFISGSKLPIFNEVVTAKTITVVDATSVGYSLTAADLTQRSAFNTDTNAYAKITPVPAPWAESTAPLLYPNKQNAFLSVANAGSSTNEVTFSCGITAPVTKGIPVKTGKNYTFSIYSAASSTSRTLTANIKWYDRFGVLMKTTTGDPVTNSVGTFGARATVTDLSPTNLTLNSFNSTAGTGYVDGTYNNVPLTYVSGKQFTIAPRGSFTVYLGAVLSLTITNGGAGADTTTILSVANSSLGGTGSGFQVTVQRCQECYYAVPGVTVSNVGNLASNERHYFDAAQFEQSATVTSFDEARQLHVTLKANRINEIRNPHFVAPYTPWSASASTLSVRTDVAEPNVELYNSVARVAGSGTGTIELSVIHTFKAGDQIYVTGLGSPFDGLKTLTSVSDFTVSFAASGTVASAASTVGVVCKGGDALVITSSGTSQVILKSFVTTADLMDIHYPDTTYTFSLYAKTEQSSDVVIPSIVWYNSAKTIISTSTSSSTFMLNTNWSRPNVTAIAPSNAAYAAVQLTWTPAATGHKLNVDTALFENSPFVLDFFDGSSGPAATNELFWEGSTPNNARSHYYKNRVAIQERLIGGALKYYLLAGTTYAVYLAQPKT
jgi:hypothetical protein